MSNDANLLQRAAKIAIGCAPTEELPDSWKADLSALAYGGQKGMTRLFQRVMAGTETLPPNFIDRLADKLCDEGQALLAASADIRDLGQQ